MYMHKGVCDEHPAVMLPVGWVSVCAQKSSSKRLELTHKHYETVSGKVCSQVSPYVRCNPCARMVRCTGICRPSADLT